jgi:hypothetical protein
MRRPLAWLILLEIALVAALAAATYHVLATRWPSSAPHVAAAPAPAPAKPQARATPRPAPPKAVPTSTPPKSGPAPGLSTDAGFWDGQLKRINRDQAALADLQARAARAVTDWLRAYVDGVLLPAVRQAERSS